MGGECRSITPDNQNLICFGAFECSINEFREPVAYSIVFNSDSRFNGTARVRTFTTQLMFRQYKRERFIVRSVVLILTRNNGSESGGPKGLERTHSATRTHCAHATHATHAHERLMAVKSGVGGEAADEAERGTPR